jgi:signal transduction histidine kinase/ActR/RegA family two-component response regulator
MTMQNPLRNLAIRTRLILLATGSSCVAIAIASAGFSYFDTQTLQDALIAQTTSDAELLAFSGSNALLAGDEAAAEELLRSLSRQPDIRVGMMVDPQGEILAAYPPIPDGDRQSINEAAGRRMLNLSDDFGSYHTARYRFVEDGSLELIQPVIVADEVIGTVYLQASREGLHRKIAHYRWIVAAVVFMSLFSAVLFAVLVQRRVSDSLLSLAEMARRISHEDNYTLRMRGHAGGEVGVLFEAFNRMLDQIQHSKDAIARANDELEERVVRRTEQLAKARDAAEAANHAKSEFLANMSHEIRTPLNAVLGFTELLRHESSNVTATDRKEYLDTIHTSGGHLLQLINDILDLSRVEAGYLEVELRECSPQSLLAEVVALLSVRAKERGLEVNYHWIGPRPESIETDEYRLRQLLMNLVGNAIKFTSTGRVDILAELERVESSEADNAATDGEFFLRVAVVDTGIGIDSERLGQVFEPFSQADTSITRRYGGTGLGLAISHRVAAALGGRLEVRSTKDVGSTFTARVAARNVVWADESEESSGVIEQDQIEAEMRFDGLPRKVLIVDDGETNRKLVRLMLEKHGVETAAAVDGREGVDAILGGDFDLVLMDMQMPVLDGIAATRELRDRGVETPIVALTANAMRVDRQLCLDAGCNGYLTKPFQTRQLLKTIRDVFGAACPAVEEDSAKHLKQIG